MKNNAGFGYTLTEGNLFKLANSSDSIDKTTLEGFRFLINQNFQVAENEILGLEDIINNQSVISKLKYRNSTYLVPNLITNSDFKDWNNGVTFPFTNLSALLNIANSWTLSANGDTGVCSRMPMVPQNQTEVPEYPEYYLSLFIGNYINNPSINQQINNIVQFNGLTYNLSSYLRSSINGVKVIPKIRINYGIGNANPDITLTGSQFTTTKTFLRYSSTFTFPSDLATKATAGSYISIYFEILEQGIYEINFSSVQFELGSSPTPYKANSFLEAQSLYLVDTTLGAVELKINSTPSPGDVFAIFDVKGNFNAFKLTINPNGKKIINSYLSISIIDKYSYVSFMYIDDNIGWIVLDNTNPVNLDSGNSKISQIQNMCMSLITGI